MTGVCARPVVGGDLGDELLQDRLAEGFVVLRDHDEGAGAADDAVAVIAVEIGLEREDRQAVDTDAGGDRLVAREPGSSAQRRASVAVQKSASLSRRVRNADF